MGYSGKIRMIVCDLDGTLLNSSGRITSFTRKTLIQANQMGIKLCFASGRAGQMMEAFTSYIGGCDYILSSNGALVKDGKTGRILYSSELQPQSVGRILDELAGRDIPLVLYSAENIFYTKGCERIEKRFAAYEALCDDMGFPQRLCAVPLTKSEITIKREGVIKIVAYEEDAVLQKLLNTIERIENICYEKTGYGLLGVFAENVSKRTGLQIIMDAANVTSEQLCVFGDYENDLSMFACAKRRIAMSNAQDALKRHATAIAPSNDDDGVAKYLVRMLGLTQQL